MRKINILLVILLACAAAFAQEITQGSLYAAGKNGTQLGACPLNNTKVQTDISGFMARIKVVQEFENTFSEPIEAVYTFPLSQNSAVDNMTMRIGERVIRARIMKREEARKIYETAKSEGKTASLLDQERPNIFTQAVANIMPGEKVVIEISYVETLKYEDGSYEFVFPMTVGPRYIPGSVKDAAKISPLAAVRAGHDISIEVNVNAGVPVEAIRSSSHPVDQINFNPNSSKITLKSEKTIPNKDFILRYDVTGKRIEDAILTHRDARGGFFTLMLQPPDKIATEDRSPKEIVFVLDTSGSMSGFPIEKAKEAMKLSLDGLYPEDTFNLITFAGDTEILFEQPVPATQANLEKAQAFLDSRQGGGGTEMMTAIKAAFEPSDSQSHLRIVCFMTDAYVGNENEIIAEIQKHPKARVFSFGIGSSVNRFLLDKMAEAGNGEVEYVALTDDGSKAAKKFYERVRTPLLTDISIDWNGMPVADVYPNKLSDLFSAKPVILHGRFTKAASGKIKLKGKIAGQQYVREIVVNLPEAEAANDVLATLWARRRIDELSSEALKGVNTEALNNQIAGIGIEFRLLTQFTSFVAVEERVVNQNGTPAKIEVPVVVPEGVDPKISGTDVQEVVTVSGGLTSGQLTNLPVNGRRIQNLMVLQSTTATVDVSKSKSRKTRSNKSGSGVGRGSSSGSGYGTASLSLSAPPPPPPPAKSGDPNSSFSRMEIIAKLQRPPTVSAGVINGKAIGLPKPAYPAAAKAVNASGTVSVYVTIDESGKVVSAEPVGGHPLLRAAAKQAATEAKFAPTMLSGQPVKVLGMITYNFVDPDKTAAVMASVGNLAVKTPNTEVPTVEMIREWAIKEKLHSWIYYLVERLRKGELTAGPNEANFVREGKAEILIVVKTTSPKLMEKLKNAGFEIASEKGTTITGRIAVEKIAALAEIGEIILILPKT